VGGRVGGLYGELTVYKIVRRIVDIERVKRSYPSAHRLYKGERGGEVEIRSNRIIVRAPLGESE
jgi:hypothetical protein